LPIDGFRRTFIAGQYCIEASTNNERYFIAELFSSLTLKALTQNALHFLLFSGLPLNNITFRTKLIKMNRISREIAAIPASSNPLVFRFFFFFDRIIK
jgi:hypothetical protein